jgi:uncharacterized protein YndB with AHSA1/START domain
MTASAAEVPSTSTTSSTDRIEKRFEVKAPVSRVWRALANIEEFGTWFRMKFTGTITEGATVHGQVLHPGYEHLKVEMVVQRVQPERYFSYRWHPFPNDTTRDYTVEPMTLVEFTLEATATGTHVTIVESGFDQLPADRRAEAFRMNDNGWNGQSKNLTNHVS